MNRTVGGLCGKHYQASKRNGDPLADRRHRKANEQCGAAGCTDVTVLKRGLCPKHYQAWWKHGDPLFSQDRPRNDGRCKIDGCANPTRSPKADHCEMHYGRARRNGDPLKLVLDTSQHEWCAQCGEVTHGPKFCSDRCRSRYTRSLTHGTEASLARQRRYAATRASLIQAADHEAFAKAEIFNRDNWTCAICRTPVDRTLTHPDPWSASLDHAIPLSKGGTHTRANVRCTHLRCNLTKSNKTA